MKSFAALNRKEKLIELLRWLGVLPVAWLAGLVGNMLTHFVVVYPFMSELSYEGSDRWLRHLIGGFLGGAAFVIAGAKMARAFVSQLPSSWLPGPWFWTPSFMG